VIDPLSVGLIVGGFTLVSSAFALIFGRSKKVVVLQEPIKAQAHTEPPPVPTQEPASEPVASKIKRTVIRYARGANVPARAIARKAVTAVRRTRVVVRVAYHFIKEFAREAFGSSSEIARPQLTQVSSVGSCRVIQISPFLKITPRIRDAIPADIAA
jgi:hypothetical protein